MYESLGLNNTFNDDDAVINFGKFKTGNFENFCDNSISNTFLVNTIEF